MAVVSCVEVWSGRVAHADYKRERTYVRVFKVFTDDPRDDQITAGAAAGIEIGDFYESALTADDLCWCVSIDVRQIDDSPTAWEVTYNYSSKIDFPEGKQPAGSPDKKPGDRKTDNPVSRAPVYSLTWQTTTKTIWQDRDGFAIKNSAGVYLRGGVQVEKPIPVINVEYYVPSAPFKDVVEKANTQNSLSWKGINAGTLLRKPATVDPSSENGMFCYKIKEQLLYDKDGWSLKVLDAGTMEIDADTDELIPILDRRSGQPVTELVPLDGRGEAAIEDAQPVFLTYEIYPDNDFTDIP
jgi:hypothetical protein